MCMAYDSLKEAESGSLEGAAHIQASFQSLFEVYCDVVPSYHKEKLTNLPLLAGECSVSPFTALYQQYTLWYFNQ